MILASKYLWKKIPWNFQIQCVVSVALSYLFFLEKSLKNSKFHDVVRFHGPARVPISKKHLQYQGFFKNGKIKSIRGSLCCI